MRAAPALHAVISACVEKPLSAVDVLTATGLLQATVTKTLSNARTMGYLDSPGRNGASRLLYQTTGKGLTWLKEHPEPEESASTNAAAKPQHRTLSERALRLVLDSEEGLDSFEVAEELECTEEEADAALAMHVAMQTLVTCKVQRSHALSGLRGLREFTLYRNAAKGAPRASLSTPEQRVSGSQASRATAEAAGVREMVNAVAGASASEFLEPELRLPLVGPVDIDAAHHRNPTPRCASVATAQASQAVTAAGAGDFTCALFNDGVLVIESDGFAIELPVEHTAKLMHYLDYMRAGDLVTGLKEVL